VNKIRFVILVLALVLLSACTPTLQDEPRPLSLRFRGVDLTVGAKADGIIARLGDDYTVTEAESCAGVGVDRMYTYPSVRLYVFAPEGGEAVISSVSYTDDGALTADGLHIGSKVEEVVAVMGEPDEKSDARLVYHSDGAVLTFGLRDGVVVSVVLAGE
jgi:hypothetical protein